MAEHSNFGPIIKWSKDCLKKWRQQFTLLQSRLLSPDFKSFDIKCQGLVKNDHSIPD
jgi:hypothetical protein